MPVYECVCVGEEVDHVASTETKFLVIIKHSEKCVCVCGGSQQAEGRKVNS